MHLFGDNNDLPSIEGYLVSRRRREYLIALPSLVLAAGAKPNEFDSRYVRIPRERVAFFEEIE